MTFTLARTESMAPSLAVVDAYREYENKANAMLGAAVGKYYEAQRQVNANPRGALLAQKQVAAAALKKINFKVVARADKQRKHKERDFSRDRASFDLAKANDNIDPSVTHATMMSRQTSLVRSPTLQSLPPSATSLPLTRGPNAEKKSRFNGLRAYPPGPALARSTTY